MDLFKFYPCAVTIVKLILSQGRFKGSMFGRGRLGAQFWFSLSLRCLLYSRIYTRVWSLGERPRLDM